MEENLDTTESTESEETPSFSKELAQSFAVAAATTAGMLSAMIVIPAAVDKVRQMRQNRKAKKEAKKSAPKEA